MAPQPSSAVPGTIRVAAAQFFSGTDVRANLELCAGYLREAAAAGAQILVTPENSNRVRDFTTREGAWEHAETLDGEFVTGLRAVCAELGMYAVVGVDLRGEQAPDVHIGQLLVGPDGSILKVHRKHIFWDYEYTLFVPGDEPIEVVDTAIGRIGLLMCADGIVPEVPRLLGLAGAQILCNSLNSRGPDELRTHVPLRAMENRVWHISANTVGGPADAYPWMGGSQVVSPGGEVVAVAGEAGNMMIWADIQPVEADDKWASFGADVITWRRPDLYGDLVRPVADLPVAAMYGPAGDTPSKPLTVAPLQVSWFHNQDWTVTRALGQISYAATRGIQLGVLPELFCFERDEVAADPAAAARISLDVLARIVGAVAGGSLRVVVSLVEESAGQYFSTAWLVGPEGVEGSYRKAHLSGAERRWATAGDHLSVLDTPIGRIGFMIGTEVWLPEVARVLTVRGAEVIVHPTDADRAQALTVAAVERAEENRVHLISSNRLDSPSGLGSQVVQADEFVPGQPIALMRFPTAWTCRGGFEEQMRVELDLRESHSKVMGLHLDPVATRQPHIYSPFVTLTTELSA
ncbi:carbon-nitrogen hydrolase family protein [Kineosporia sp. NBRC 101731]|uniref:carbon-nitrogen hydrolase family protein n=1 Tax=Kineosporia sp. NBRC 101731 TaxID=3032199 RepID=UPI0024A2C2A5|nr:carbon-nitrogen hydrolase family protein [Kineosporia sp. NBRC 101731]GLY29646.1 amidohydrolase [Kineosporia sp. NBRC 101731]